MRARIDVVFALLGVLCTPLTNASEPPRRVVLPDGVVEWFTVDPTTRTDLDLGGAVLDRILWNDDRPAFPGDVSGSLTARYDATLAAGTLGLPLPRPWTEDDAFTAAAVFVIASDGYDPDPFGYFQISWGLWNHATTGLERTGTPQDFAADTFELLEFDYYPNVSPWFGGPFVAPTLFGRAVPDDPSFEFLGAFVNASFVFGGQAMLPLDTPLIAVMQHRPDDDVVETIVAAIAEDGTVVEVPGSGSILAVDALAAREFSLDTAGVTLWRDGFSGPTPSLRADVTFHAIFAVPGLVDADDLLRIRPVRR